VINLVVEQEEQLKTYYTTTEVKEKLKLKTMTTVYAYINSGALKASRLKTGKKVRLMVKQDDLVDFLEGK